MIGRHTHFQTKSLKGFLHTLFGTPDIHTRQKWAVMNPTIKKFLNGNNINLLDAGCDIGNWSIELGLRNPSWKITGVDINIKAIQLAQKNAKTARVKNCHFIPSNFLTYQPHNSFDGIISVLSSHYLATEGKGEELFQKFSSWLQPTGKLILLGPQKESMVPYFKLLPKFPWHPVFSEQEIRDYCKGASLKIDSLTPVGGSLATLAKQISISNRKFLLTKIILYPFTFIFSLKMKVHNKKRKSIMWLLVATKQ